MAEACFEVDLPDREATLALGRRLGEACPPGTVLLLAGDLGSGKTTLVQGLGAGLGIAEPIGSPTFTLVNEYREGRIPLYHVDLYRLAPAQVGSLELESYGDGQEVPPGVLAIEWAERWSEPPREAIRLSLGDGPGGGRRATLRAAAQTTWLAQVIGKGN
ncbi:MAG TPA: tRNA (adenosine(37)-N6)-threonylcarbamoyltransferase complex ATPase subunit type 1 TsaE [Nodosilinea sp.]|nr:tRNA (adenosine(37)-N6)-threonylcarbamoyltransferase complex ATPase subunit type 1 TsaE [Nodosilinea sp.]